MDTAEKKSGQNKYDRQLRLWGQHGQQCLMDGRVLLLGGSPAGVETLKNMVLPGIGFISVVDGGKVTDRDLGNNFFVEVEDLGKDKAEVLLNRLLELNPDVKGEFHVADPEDLLANKPEFFKNYTFVIASQLSESGAKRLSQVAKTYNLGAVILRTLGFVGSIRAYGGIHTVVESKPADKQIEDQRIMKPFPELLEFANSFDLKSLDRFELGLVPYTVILIQALENWKKEHDGKRPSTFAEKKEFTDKIKGQVEAYYEYENFPEAVTFSFRAHQDPADLPYKLTQVLENERTKNADGNSAEFWIFAKALGLFIEKHGLPPLKGGLPDQHASTANFMNLKKIYDDKAARDLDELKSFIKQIAPERTFTEDSIKDFAKNALTIEVTEYRSITDEVEKPIPLEVFETDCYKWHFALRGAFLFKEREGRFPSLENGTEDVKKLEKIVNEEIIKDRYEGLVPIETTYFEEMARYGDSQLHTISSLLGGVASQEIIKLITHQFTPINNTYVYNGITSEAECYEF